MICHFLVTHGSALSRTDKKKGASPYAPFVALPTLSNTQMRANLTCDIDFQYLYGLITL